MAGSFWWSWCIATAGIAALHVDAPRPRLLTLLFFTVEPLLIFHAEQTEEEKFLYRLGPLFLVWANCHIEFVYGIAVWGL